MTGRPFRRQWTWPIVLATLTAVGLVMALAGEHVLWRFVSWALLGIPVAVAIHALVRALRESWLSR